MTGLAAIAAWTGPVLVTAVVAQVSAGGVEAPLFVLAAVAAPLLAVLAGPDPRVAGSGLGLVIGLVVAGCVLAAGFRALVDVGRELGLETGTVAGSLVVLVLATTLWPRRTPLAVAGLVIGAGALALALAVVGTSLGASPWTAWSRVASRGAFALGPESPWTREGIRFAAPITLPFSEPHRVAAVGPLVARVREDDRAPAVVREWRLAAGESLTLRPGDLLSLPAGARVRFEAGKRVPGTPSSGVAWAEAGNGAKPRRLVTWLGLVITLVGGALVVVRPPGSSPGRSAAPGPPLVLAVVLVAACWAVYAVDVAPELVIGGPPAASLTGLAAIVTGEPWRSRLLAAVVLGLTALLLGSAAALREHLSVRARRGPGRLADSLGAGALGHVVWIGLVIVAAAGSLAAADGWSLVIHGSGLAAATLVGPRLAVGDRPACERAWAAGVVAGGVLFVAGTVLAPGSSSPVQAVASFPALLAAPGAWLVARLGRAAGDRRRDEVAAARRR